MTIADLYTEKQIEIFREAMGEEWFILINHGAKRSGKTVLNNDIFLLELQRIHEIAKKEGVAEPMYILAGVSSATIQKNVLQEITNKYHIEFKFDKYNNFKLFGVKVIQASTGTIAGVGAIRGMTAYGAYVNEASLANKEVFAEIISRCSGEGARIIADTNPADPRHWLKTEYIDKAGINKNIRAYSFKLDDNTFLTERYKSNIKAATPSGMFYARDIEGLWTSGDGVIYQDFDNERHFIARDKVPKDIKEYYCGVDWGFEHSGVIVVLAETKAGEVYLIEEYAARHQEIDYWTAIAKDIQSRYNIKIPFYCDSARPEHVARFNREKLRATNAKKNVLSGIEELAKLIKTDRFFVVDEAVTLFKDEIYQYIWNKKTGEPIKLHDDSMDAIRYAVYTHHHGRAGIKTFKGGM